MLNTTNKFTLGIVAAGLGLAAATTASLADEGAYISGGLGLHAPDSRTAFVNGTPLDIQFKNGGVGIAALGYDFDSPLRLEFELGYRRAVVESVGGPLGIGDQSQWTGLFNALMDIEMDAGFTPYIGFGLGLADTKWDTVAGGGTWTYDGSNTDITWQGIVGAAFPLSDRLNLTFDYRYVDSSGGSFESVMAGAPALDRYSPQSHNIMVGLRFNLWEPTPARAPAAQPAPPPRPAPAPAPAPVAKGPEQFIVFFDWDRSVLTSEAQGIVQNAAAYAKREGSVRITSTGHADRSGTVAYNLGLSENRAQAVRDGLVRAGIPASDISIRFKGESEPLVNTADGVREPQNRRVEIVIE